jgi:hypothetical protein
MAESLVRVASSIVEDLDRQLYYGGKNGFTAENVLRKAVMEAYRLQVKEGHLTKTANDYANIVIDALNQDVKKGVSAATTDVPQEVIKEYLMDTFFIANPEEIYPAAKGKVFKADGGFYGKFWENVYLGGELPKSKQTADIKDAVEVKVTSGDNALRIGSNIVNIPKPMLVNAAVQEATQNMVTILILFQKMISLLLVDVRKEDDAGRGGFWTRFRFASAKLYSGLNFKKIMRSFFRDKTNISTFFTYDRIKPADGWERLYDENHFSVTLGDIAVTKVNISFTTNIVKPFGSEKWSLADLYKNTPQDFFSFPGAAEAWVRAMIDLQTERKLFSTNPELRKYYLEFRKKPTSGRVRT